MSTRKLKLTLLLVVLAVTVALPMHPSAQAQDDDPVDEPKPLLVMMSYGSWAPLPDLATPNFALYDDGTLIYRSEYVDPAATAEPFSHPVNFDYRTLQLDKDALTAFLARLPLDEFQTLDAGYIAVEQPAEPSYRLAVWEDDKIKTVWAYGSLRQDEEGRAKMPTAYMIIFDTLVAFVQAEHPEAEIWLPDHLEIGLIEGEMGFDGLEWPTTWPGLDDPTTMEGDGYWIINLDPSEYPAAVEFIEQSIGMTTLHEVRYVVVLHLPFPHEALWIEAFRDWSVGRKGTF